MHNPRIGTLVDKVRRDWPHYGVSAYTGPLHKPHVQMIVVSPHGKTYTCRFYNHGQYAWFMKVQKDSKKGGDASSSQTRRHSTKAA